MADVRESTYPRELEKGDATQYRRARPAETGLRAGLLVAVIFSLACWGGLIAVVRILI